MPIDDPAVALRDAAVGADGRAQDGQPKSTWVGA